MSEQLALGRIRDATNGTHDVVDLIIGGGRPHRVGRHKGRGWQWNSSRRKGQGSEMVLCVRGRAGWMLASRWRELGPPVGRSGEAHVTEVMCKRVERRATY
jgi:hypothetical protein